MVFNRKRGYCPARLPLRCCAAVHFGLEQAGGAQVSSAASFYRMSTAGEQTSKKKKKVQ